MIGSSEHPMFSFGVPPDIVAWAALILAGLILLIPQRSLRNLCAGRPHLLVVTLGGLAALLSYGYFHYYLGGHPRIIDATSYLLEARSFASGSFSFSVPAPTASFRGRFLIPTAADAHELAVIFPPGYPAILSLGVVLGHPEGLGPVLAAALVGATYGLTRRLTDNPRTGLLAACLSALNACLRYHTAETMSHGWSALLTTLALWAAVALSRPPVSRRWTWLLGASLGLLLATRQLTGLLVALACGLALGAHSLLAKPRSRCSPCHAGTLLRFMLPAFLFALPGIALLFAHHHAITGNFLESPQSRYYDLADGPGRCFGWGLGRGCAYEHADVVAQQGGAGLTGTWALRNTLHRLHWHALDIANCEPLVLLGLVAGWQRRKRAEWRPLLCAIPVLWMGYSLFYFNGSYPGAGARFFSEVLPCWHALVAAGASSLRWEKATVCAALVGFALHGAYSHQLLNSAHFGPDLRALNQLPPDRSLPERATGAPSATALPNRPPSKPTYVFFGTAHGFNLATLRDDSFVAARDTPDSRIEWLISQPRAASAWRFDAGTSGPALRALAPALDEHRVRLETEFDYPPLAIQGAWAHPSRLHLPCVSRGLALRVEAEAGGDPDAFIDLELDGGATAPRRVEVHWVKDGQQCRRHLVPVETGATRLTLRLRAYPGLTHLDYLEWSP